MCGAACIPQYSCGNQRQLAEASFLFLVCGSREQNRLVRHSIKCWHLMGLKYNFETKISKKNYSVLGKMKQIGTLEDIFCFCFI